MTFGTTLRPVFASKSMLDTESIPVEESKKNDFTLIRPTHGGTLLSMFF